MILYRGGELPYPGIILGGIKLDINTLKTDLLETLDGIDKERLSLCDLKE